MHKLYYRNVFVTVVLCYCDLKLHLTPPFIIFVAVLGSEPQCVSFSMNEELFNTKFSGTNSSKKPAEIFQRRLVFRIAIFQK